MRTIDRRLTDRREIDALLGRARISRASFAVGNEPYILPLSHEDNPKYLLP